MHTYLCEWSTFPSQPFPVDASNSHYEKIGYCDDKNRQGNNRGHPLLMETLQSVAKFTQQNLLKYIQGIFTDLPDSRIGANIQYQMEDAVLSAFAVFFMQKPSFLAQHWKT